MIEKSFINNLDICVITILSKILLGIFHVYAKKHHIIKTPSFIYKKLCNISNSKNFAFLTDLFLGSI